MGPGLVVVLDELANRTKEMPSSERDEVIGAFPSNRPDHALRERVLPGRPWSRANLPDPQGLHHAIELPSIDAVTVVE